MVDGARAIADSGLDWMKRHRAFSQQLRAYRNSILEVVPDAARKYLAIVLASPGLVYSEEPCGTIREHITADVIEPAARMTHAWLYWVLTSRLLPSIDPDVLPIAPERLCERKSIFPDWWFQGPEDPNRRLDLGQDHSDMEQHETRMYLKAHLERELEQANVAICTARLKGRQLPALPAAPVSDRPQGQPTTVNQVNHFYSATGVDSGEAEAPATEQPATPVPHRWHSDDYTRITIKGERFQVTDMAAGFLKLLDGRDKGDGCTKRDLGFGKSTIKKLFRQQDGKKVYSLLVKVIRNRYFINRSAL